jgi:hypothetical protein
MVTLSSLVHEHGKDSNEVDFFITQHRNLTWTDKHSNDTCYFEEFARGMAVLMGGFNISNVKDPEPPDPADYWKSGERPFETDSKDSADWWKSN